MSNLFNIARNARPRKNAFNLSHEVKMSMNMAELTPFYLEEVVPGDKFSVSSEIMMRLAPMISPVMHRVNVFTHFWFVPNRIVWDGWKDFITGGEDGQNAAIIPRMAIDTANAPKYAKGTLADYFGVPVAPTTVADPAFINALPFRAYQEIYNEWYRDQNLQPKISYSKGDVANDDQAALTQIRIRNWEKDYYTSCLPWAQKGDPVGIPTDITYRQQGILMDSIGDSGDATPDTLSNSAVGLTAQFGGSSVGANIDNIEQLSTNVNDLRTAVRVQEWLERNARSGSRYVESILAHFSERVPDYTADRPVYLGGGKQPVVISEVLQNSASVVEGDLPHENVPASPQGNMAGHGISVGKSNNFKSKFTEHGYIIGIVSVMPRTTYQQGLDKVWQRANKFDFFWPEFAQLGEQAVLNSEVYNDYAATGEENEATFGYQSRYAEYKYRQSRVSGDFRDNLAFWHMGRIFANPPALNSDFITADPRTDIFAVEDGTLDKLYVQIYNQVKAIRPMPTYNVPTL